MFFLHIKSLPNLLFGVLCLPGDQSHPFAQPTINPLACCFCWAGLLGRAVFPPWNEGPNLGSYIRIEKKITNQQGDVDNQSEKQVCQRQMWFLTSQSSKYFLYIRRSFFKTVCHLFKLQALCFHFEILKIHVISYGKNVENPVF